MIRNSICEITLPKHVTGIQIRETIRPYDAIPEPDLQESSNSGDDPECNPQAVKHPGFDFSGIDFFGNNLLLS